MSLHVLRERVLKKLDDLGVRQEIEELVRKTASEGEKLGEADVFNHLEEKGIISNVTNAVTLDEGQQTKEKKLSLGGLASQAGTQLYIRVSKGRGFTDFLSKSDSANARLTVSICFRGNRAVSTLVPCSAEPFFNVDLLAPLLDEPSVGGNALDTLLRIREKVHVAVCTSTVDGGNVPIETHLFGFVEVDFRDALVARKGHVRKLLQLQQAEPTSTMVPGAVEISLRVVPALSREVERVAYNQQMRNEKVAYSGTFSAFLSAAKVSWTEYLARSAKFKERPLKLIAYSEDGFQRCVCDFVKPLSSNRRLKTPKQAAYWTSLLATDAMSQFLGNAGSRWSSFETVLARGSAQSEERALLLCSLLLGFGLDAYVCYGLDESQRTHAWVMTAMKEGGSAPGSTVMFWEPSNAACYSIFDCPYATVATCFNDRAVFLNCQPDDRVTQTLFTLESTELWMPIYYNKKTEGKPPREFTLERLPLAHATLDRAEEETRVGAGVKGRIETLRASKGLTETRWDETLEHVLGQALEAYEIEVSTGQAAPGNLEFQQCVKRMVPLGYTFKGIPNHFKHRDVERMATALLEDSGVLDIVLCGRKETALAVSVGVTVYPGDLCSTWIMVASRAPK